MMRATHQREFANMQPTGKQFTVTGIEMHRFADGKLVELWNVVDALEMLQQLSVMSK